MTKLLLLIFGGLKLGKVLMSAGTMLASIAVYALFYGWRFAAGFVALLLVHEAGHYVAAQRRGLDVGLPTFIPFVGAWIQLKEMPHDAETEAYVGLAGPFVGTLGALACYAAARHYDSNLLLALAYTGFFLNLFNMIPLSPFDGGRITAVLSPRIWFAGVPVLIALFAYRPSPLLIVMAILALPQLKRAWRYDPDAPEDRAYYATSVETKTTYALFYVGLLAFLALMTSGVHDMLRVAHSAA
ncbi:TPA: site-2 protease family protein [Burkholderia territorii]|uniref:site-2 protease family protein n=1 Tax=Burkholderia territorii TaxID=1503055 RepID=UPI000758306B|nr:site-2 protease family protein [Burkholderia territorii]KWH10449.1 peptidase M50 [Burkholderia territorii]TXG04654.1 site-2 protease family protein [Burkholderia territorii]HDR8856512.1 site-2 protease family protein [Burkholderia territorii]HDR8864671.1 site-2 protease family protein [Burkholderia territorii]HDR8869941.1 site-2 protease family protein [Burkholderia territorii]